mgnify:CR=1 FL=1
MISELQRISVVPLLLSRDTGLISDINTKDYQLTSQRLITFSDEIRVKSITLLERFGRIVASSDRSDLGQNLRGQNFFFNAMRQSGTVFTISDNEKGRRSFFCCRHDQGIKSHPVELLRYAALIGNERDNYHNLHYQKG